MEELLELLLEYDSGLYAMLRIKQNINGTNILEIFDSLNFLQNFTKWLVKKNKIDRENQAMQYAKEDLSKFFNERKDKNGMSDDYAMLLMLLAIQDEPIEFLISVLK